MNRFLVWVGSWVESLGSFLVMVSGLFYHHAGEHWHCARLDALADDWIHGAEQALAFQRMHERARDARQN